MRHGSGRSRSEFQLGGGGDPRDFAGPVVFLASSASQYVCGELLVVDGVSYSIYFVLSDKS
jgi:NAD(P)-dependent dehydrogenase (short-subunit alcohol dehydrogenase family)